MPAIDVPDEQYDRAIADLAAVADAGVDALPVKKTETQPGEMILVDDPDKFIDRNNIFSPKSTNPKDQIGINKPPIHLVPAVAIIHEAMAFKDGAEKYGPYNWRGESVSASVYMAACYRHLMAWFDGEEFARDSRVHHLGHARACLAIILDAASVGKLVDDRPSAGSSATLLSSLSMSVKGNTNEHEQGQQSEGSPHSTDRR